ncbi:hypothetical protein VaNZ11_015218 [Volvox africanus]|uniref:Reverse transcriptase Ty1/copia-type domain-containing protein n=1 Tax=Volvox africanus TaxID=51714 RepID=A0ABQ5SLD2_9CHLO|nr:hypothetical protein VaNZ11_015218 [Volvox africanus]
MFLVLKHSINSSVAASSVEAEYQALSSAVREALWLTKLCEDLHTDIHGVKIHVDSQGALILGKNPITSSRSKHIDLQHHMIRERVADGGAVLKYQRTEEMVADVLPKLCQRRNSSGAAEEWGWTLLKMRVMTLLETTGLYNQVGPVSRLTEWLSCA